MTFVQQRVAEVRAARLAFLDRASTSRAADTNRQHAAVTTVAVGDERPLLRGELEPDVIVDEDGTVRLAPLEWASEASDAFEQ